jgi:hypothetical protein
LEQYGIFRLRVTSTFHKGLKGTEIVLTMTIYDDVVAARGKVSCSPNYAEWEYKDANELRNNKLHFICIIVLE